MEADVQSNATGAEGTIFALHVFERSTFRQNPDNPTDQSVLR